MIGTVVAVRADKRLLPSVSSDVPRQDALVARAVLAVLADKGLLPSVNSQVCRQVALVARAVAAVLADKRLLPIVQPQVRRQAALLGGLIPTVLALVDRHVVAAALAGSKAIDRKRDVLDQSRRCAE